jgi:prepilin-type processing-associated H-X9-DG protein
MAEEKPRGGVLRLVIGIALIALALVVGSGFFVVGLTSAALARARLRAARTKCANNLKQISLGAIQYADDHRFFPHLGPISQLDNGGSTIPTGNDVSPRVVRSLVWFNYLDEAGVFVCPASNDRAAAVGIPSPKTFGWGGSATTGGNPLLVPAPADRDADALTDLSYGTTIRGLTLNAPSTCVFAADRGRRVDEDLIESAEKKQTVHGNHEDGWNVVFVDGHVEWVGSGEPGSSQLSSTQAPGGGHLAVWDDADNGLPPPYPNGPRASHEAKAGLVIMGSGAVLGLALLGAGIVVIVMPRKKKTEAV